MIQRTVISSCSTSAHRFEEGSFDELAKQTRVSCPCKREETANRKEEKYRYPVVPSRALFILGIEPSARAPRHSARLLRGKKDPGRIGRKENNVRGTCTESRTARRAATPPPRATRSSSSVGSWRRSAPGTRRPGTSPWPRPGQPSRDGWAASEVRIAGRTPATSRTSRTRPASFPVRTEGKCVTIHLYKNARYKKK